MWSLWHVFGLCTCSQKKKKQQKIIIPLKSQVITSLQKNAVYSPYSSWVSRACTATVYAPVCVCVLWMEGILNIGRNLKQSSYYCFVFSGTCYFSGMFLFLWRVELYDRYTVLQLYYTKDMTLGRTLSAHVFIYWKKMEYNTVASLKKNILSRETAGIFESKPVLCIIHSVEIPCVACSDPSSGSDVYLLCVVSLLLITIRLDECLQTGWRVGCYEVKKTL